MTTLGLLALMIAGAWVGLRIGASVCRGSGACEVTELAAFPIGLGSAIVVMLLPLFVALQRPSTINALRTSARGLPVVPPFVTAPSDVQPIEATPALQRSARLGVVGAMLGAFTHFTVVASVVVGTKRVTGSDLSEEVVLFLVGPGILIAVLLTGLYYRLLRVKG